MRKLSKDNLPSLEELLGAPDEQEIDHFERVDWVRMQMDALSENNETPDTYMCDKYFLELFITPEMEDDFNLIARDFLLHELPNLKDHETVHYLDTDPLSWWPERHFQHYILNLMMNAVNYGSEYTKSLFRYLHRTYYRKEYKQLRRFNRISGEEVLSVAKLSGDTFRHSIPRVLTMARLYGIELTYDCNMFYLDFTYDGKDKEETPARDSSVEEIISRYRKCEEEVSELFESEHEMYAMEANCDRFLQNLLKSQGADEDYVFTCNENEGTLKQRLARTLAILKKTFRDKPFSKEEILLYAMTYQTVTALLTNAWDIDERMDVLLYGEKGTDFYEEFPPLFHAEEVESAKATNVTIPKKTENEKATKEEETAEDAIKQKALEEEVAKLQRRVHQQEDEIKHLRGELAGKHKTIEENREIKEQLNTEHRELVAMREHLYRMTEEDEAVSAVSTEEMRDFLRAYRIVIVGGHSNWQNKMKREFPDWTYVNPSVSGTMDTTVVEKADFLYFFTDTLGHSAYNRYINVVREREAPFGYIHGVNIENNIRQIYNELRHLKGDSHEI